VAVQIIIDENLAENSEILGKIFLKNLSHLKSNPGVKEIRGKSSFISNKNFLRLRIS